jgi:hypothetical protein
MSSCAYVEQRRGRLFAYERPLCAARSGHSIDTEAFGTFAGDIVRQGTMLDAARAEALAAIEATGLELGLGSKGSFGPHPSVPFIPAGTEVLLCLDRKRGLEIHDAGY